MIQKAQGTIEYLIILAIVIVISLVVVGLFTGFFSSSSSVVTVNQGISGKIGSGGINVLDAVSDSSGDVILHIKNSTGDGFSVSKISSLSGGTVIAKQYNDVYVQVGDEVAFALDTLTGSCVCNGRESKKVCDFEVTLTNSTGLVKKQRISRSVDCVTNTVSTGSVVNSFGAIWAQGATNGTGTNNDVANSVIVDLNGNVYLGGYFNSTSLGFGNDVNLTNRGSFDFFVVKYNSSGVAQWAKNPAVGSGTLGDQGLSIYVDLNGNVYLGGYSASNISFGNDVNLTNRGSNDFFVVKYNSSGVAQWAKNPGAGTGSNIDTGYTVFVDLSGNVYLGGEFYSTTLGFGNDVNLTNRGNSDFFVVKYNSSGVAQWAKNPGAGTGASYDYGRSVFVDSSENVYFGGYFTSTSIGFGNDVNLTNRGSNDFFVVKYNSSGVAQWAKNPSTGTGLSSDRVKSIFVDSSGNVYLLGDFSTDLSFGNDVNLVAGTFFFVAKYNSSGVAQWAKSPVLGDGGTLLSDRGLFVDSSGNVYVTGQVDSQTFSFGSEINLAYRGGPNMFVVKYNSGGNPIWVIGALNRDGLGDDYTGSVLGYAVFVDSSSNVYVVGEADSNVSFSSGVYLINRNNSDFFVAKYGYR